MNLLANPVLARELRGRIRGNRALLIMTIYLLITGAVTLLVYAASSGTMSNSNDPETGRWIGRGIFLTVMTAALIQVCVITPSLTAGSVVGEKERQSYDLLITTLLSPWQIALGKLAAAIGFAMLLIISALPMAGLAFLFGGVSGTELAIGVVGLAAASISYASVGLFWSTVMRTTLGATVIAQGSLVALLLGIPFLYMISMVIMNSWRFDNGPIWIYITGALLCLHPFIALGMTETSIIGGKNPFYFDIPTSSGDVIVPSPWLVYVFYALLITVICLFLTVRLLRPVEYRVRRRRGAA